MKVLQTLLGVFIACSLTSVAFGQQNVINITKVNGVNSSPFTNVAQPYTFDSNSNMESISGQPSQFEFKIEISVSIYVPVNGCFLPLQLIVTDPNNNEQILSLGNYDQNGTSEIDLKTLFSVHPIPAFFNNYSIQLVIGDIPSICTSLNTQISPKYYFKVDYEVPPVNDFDFASNSPLVENGSAYSLDYNWTQIPDPKPGHIWVDGYIPVITGNQGVGFQKTASTGTLNFSGADPGLYKRNQFTLKVKDNYNNLSDDSNKSYVYDSSQKGVSGSISSAIEIIGSDLTCADATETIFNGWFEVAQNMSVDVDKLYFNTDSNGNVTRLNFTGGVSTFEFDSALFGTGTEITANGGNLTIESPNLLTLTNSNFAVNSGNLTLNSDINFENGSSLLVNSNLTLSPNKTIRIKNGSKLTVNSNTNITYESGASIIVENGAFVEMEGLMNLSDFNALNLTMETGSSYKLVNNAKLTIDEGFTTDKDFDLGTNAEIKKYYKK